MGLNDINNLGYNSEHMKGANEYAVFQKSCLEDTGEFCHNSHRDAPIYDYMYCTTAMPTPSGAGYLNLVTLETVDDPTLASKNKLEGICGVGYIFNKNDRRIRSDEIDTFLKSKKTRRKVDINVGKKGWLSVGAGAGFVTLDSYGLLDNTQPIAVEGRLSGSIKSGKKKSTSGKK